MIPTKISASSTSQRKPAGLTPVVTSEKNTSDGSQARISPTKSPASAGARVASLPSSSPAQRAPSPALRSPGGISSPNSRTLRSHPSSPVTKSSHDAPPALSRHFSSPVTSSAQRPAASPKPGNKICSVITKPPEQNHVRVRLRGLARAVWALTALSKTVWKARTSSEEVKMRFAEMRTNEGEDRMMDLPLTPLTNMADQRARDEVSCVAPGVMQTNWRGAEGLSRLKAKRVTHVLSMLDAAENPHTDDLTYMNLVFEDEDDQLLATHLPRGIDFVRQGAASGGCVVHCAAGVSRSSSFVLAYLMVEYGWTLKESFRALRERRPIAWPNPGFMSQLITFEGTLFGGRTSIRPSDYGLWASENQEAIVMAKLVDRDKTTKVSSVR